MGGVVFPPYCLTGDQTMVEVMKIMVTSFKSSHEYTTELSAPDPAAVHHSATPLPETPAQRVWSRQRVWQVWVCLLWDHYSFLLGPGVHKVLFAPFMSLFPQFHASTVIKCTGLQSQIPWGFSVPLPDPQVVKSVMGPRTFITVRISLV